MQTYIESMQMLWNRVYANSVIDNAEDLTPWLFLGMLF